MTHKHQGRPDVMDQLTESQLKELEFHFDEGHREEFNEIASTYGWSVDLCQSVWSWFESGKRATSSQGGSGGFGH